MDIQEKLSSNLILHYLEENVVKNNNELTSIQFNFSFYGEYCYAIISRKCIQSDWGSVAFAESRGELHDSFIEAIEETHWEKIKEYWIAFENEYNLEYPIEEGEAE